jgi:hypothetical protein
MAITATINLPTHIKGDTFRRLDFVLSQTLSSPEGGIDEPIDLTSAQIILQVRPFVNSEVVYLNLGVGDGITIVDESQGRFQIDEQVIDIPVGKHYYDIEITLNNGFKFTWFIGSWTITSDISHE